jgi:hypothetical protein
MHNDKGMQSFSPVPQVGSSVAIQNPGEGFAPYSTKLSTLGRNHGAIPYTRGGYIGDGRSKGIWAREGYERPVGMDARWCHWPFRFYRTPGWYGPYYGTILLS